MEKTIIAALLMLISLTLYAQGLMWTAKAGLNMSSMSNVEESGSPDKPGGLSIQLCKSEKKEFYIRYSS